LTFEKRKMPEQGVLGNTVFARKKKKQEEEGAEEGGRKEEEEMG
jgi:hypothetical protein